ncbi:MAG TPA: hypothetical protein VEK08_04225 [Planctomycetota bacterium]|nr:hypothetical protein [Planctomycetota bacterium]
MTRGCHSLLSAVLLVILASEFPITAASRLTSDFNELLRLADAIVEVKVLEVHSRERKSTATLRIERVIKGDVPNAAPLEIEYLGGYDGPYRVISPGQPNFSAGEHALLLLKRSENEQRWHVLGGDVGQVTIATDGLNQRLARRASGKFEFFVADAESLSGFRKVNSVEISYQQLERLITAVLESGRPELAEPEAPVASVAASATGDDPILRALTKPSKNEWSFTSRALLFLAISVVLFGLMRRLRAKAV